MTQKKTLGRKSDNEIVIDNPRVSSHHAVISYMGGNKYQIEDVGSTNGTFVNGMMVKRANFTDNDKIKLADTEIDVNRIFGNNKSAAPVVQVNDGQKYTPQFLALKQVYDEYQLEKKNISGKAQMRATLIRTGVLVGIPALYYTALGVVPGDSVLRQPFFFPIMSTLANTAAMFATGNINANEQLQTRYEDFVHQYVCHSCQRHLGTFSWDFYAKKGSCPYCEAKYKI
jgi:hypothetical protein